MVLWRTRGEEGHRGGEEESRMAVAACGVTSCESHKLG